LSADDLGSVPHQRPFDPELVDDDVAGPQLVGIDVQADLFGFG
jgi:hypothetical protein